MMAGQEASVIAPWLQYLAGGGFFIWMAASFVNIATKIRGSNGKNGKRASCVTDPKVIGALLMMEDVTGTQKDIKESMVKVEIVHNNQNNTLDGMLEEEKKQTKLLETLVKHNGGKK